MQIDAQRGFQWIFHVTSGFTIFLNYRNMNPRPKKAMITARLIVKGHPLLQMKILVAGILTQMELILNPFKIFNTYSIE